MNTFAPCEFAAALLNPDLPPPRGLSTWNGSDPRRRFAVHRNNVIVSLVDTLAELFPVVQKLVGNEFFAAMAAAYVRSQPPSSPELWRHGEGFADWLETFAPVRPLDYLPDMARLEQARVRAFHAADVRPIDPARLAAHCAHADALPRATVRLHPSVQLLCLRHDVHALWHAHQVDREPADVDLGRPCQVLVLRDAADDVLVIGLDDQAADFVAALASGANLGGALARSPGVDLVEVLALLIRNGAIATWLAAGDCP